jgi:acyl dehydratase
MKASTKRVAKRCAIDGFLLAAVGLRVGYWAYDHVAFFLPGATLRKLRHLKPGGGS